MENAKAFRGDLVSVKEKVIYGVNLMYSSPTGYTLRCISRDLCVYSPAGCLIRCISLPEDIPINESGNGGSAPAAVHSVTVAMAVHPRFFFDFFSRFYHGFYYATPSRAENFEQC